MTRRALVDPCDRLCVVVCGSRRWTDRAAVTERLEQLACLCRQELEVVEGGARGADRIAGEWAKAAATNGHPWTHVTHTPFPADWDGLGRRAGPIRNAEMANYLSERRIEGWELLCLAFLLPDSRGTVDMVARCRQAQIKGVKIRPAGV